MDFRIRKPFKTDKGATSFSVDYLHILPETLRADVEINLEVRYRGIYEVLLYQALIRLKGTFLLPKLDEQDILPENLMLLRALEGSPHFRLCKGGA